MDDLSSSPNIPNPHSISSLTNCQRTIAKGHLIDSYIKAHRIFPSFLPLNPEFSSGSCIIDIFSDQFSFNLVNKKEKEKDKIHAQELNDMVFHNSSLSHTALVITNTSIKKDIATSISYIHIANHLLTKTVHHALFVTSIEEELFSIRCGINQACSNKTVSKIIVITDSIHAARKIFDSNSHPFQLHSAAILKKLRDFFNSNPDNSIEFWECPSCLKWRFHHDIDKDSKSFHPIPFYPCKHFLELLQEDRQQ